MNYKEHCLKNKTGLQKCNISKTVMCRTTGNFYQDNSDYCSFSPFFPFLIHTGHTEWKEKQFFLLIKSW